jgi:hypothetical protein
MKKLIANICPATIICKKCGKKNMIFNIFFAAMYKFIAIMGRKRINIADERIKNSNLVAQKINYQKQ